MGGINRIKSVMCICKYQMEIQYKDLRTRAVFLMLFLYMGGLLSPLRDFSKMIDQGISLWLFPVFTNDMVCSMILFCFWCILVCDTPFRNKGYLYYVGRTGKLIWMFGQLLFLLVFSAIYMFSIQIFSMILSLPHLIFTAEWGKTLGTLAYTDASLSFPMPFSLPGSLMSAMSPLEATVYSMLLAWMAAFLLGTVILAINYIGKTTIGAVCAIALVLFDITVNNVLDWIWLRYSPVSLTRLSLLMGRFTYINAAWALKFLTGITLITIGAVLICVKTRKGLE